VAAEAGIVVGQAVEPLDEARDGGQAADRRHAAQTGVLGEQAHPSINSTFEWM
jgi:hypothetical protein